MTAPGSEEFPKPFGPYVLLSAFAHGGMGEVYLAKSGGIAGIDRLCVLKKLRPDFTQNEEYVNRFLDEARLVVQLNHANVANVFDVGKVGREYYLAMEYVSGVTIRALMSRALEAGTQVPTDAALWMMCEALEALDYAHRLEHQVTGKPLNLVHRDVSPHNIMCSYEGEVKLIDFGLAHSELKEEQTESQVVMGKVAYMSPEQARGEKVDASCDQFAAAICVYEILANERFYGEMSNYHIWQVVGRGGFTPQKWGVLDPALQQMLSKALHGDPKQRYASCGDFKEDLGKYLVVKYPGTNRRTARKAISSLFEDATAQERKYLSQFASISAADVREDTGSGRRDSFSLLQAVNPNGAEPPNPSGPVHGRSDTDSTATHMLSRGEATETMISASGPAVSERPNTRVLAAAGGFGALVAVVGLIAFFIARGSSGPELDRPTTSSPTVSPTSDAPNRPVAYGKEVAAPKLDAPADGVSTKPNDAPPTKTGEPGVQGIGEKAEEPTQETAQPAPPAPTAIEEPPDKTPPSTRRRRRGRVKLPPTANAEPPQTATVGVSSPSPEGASSGKMTAAQHKKLRACKQRYEADREANQALSCSLIWVSKLKPGSVIPEPARKSYARCLSSCSK
jgi:serine/threonine protein kinase